MNSFSINIIGLTAGVLTSASLVPQLYKILKTKQVRDISLYMYLILATGIFLWIVYGIMISAMPIIAANIISFVLCFLILINKIKRSG